MLHIGMLPFGETVLLWRMHRGMTQDALARAARLPRPNLSAIERGAREASLKTIRSLALALAIRPGQLVDGESPAAHTGGRLSREALERVADAVAGGRRASGPSEEALMHNLRSLLPARPGLPAARTGRRRAERAWLALSSQYPPEVIHSLIQRVRAKHPEWTAAK